MLFVVLTFCRSLDIDDSPTGSSPPGVPLLEETTGEVAPDIADCGSVAEASGEEIPLQEIKHTSKETRTDLELQEFHEHHCRLLPNYKNAIHVIDGPDRRYFVGIIDIFTVYGWKKRLEHLWKSIRYPGKDFSTVSPTKYSHRFCKWIEDHTQ